MSTTTSKIVEVYRQLAKYPTPTGAFGRFSDFGFELETTWTQRDLEKKETTKFLRNYVIPGATEGLSNGFKPLRPIGRPVDVSSELWRVYSDSGNKIAILRKGNSTEQEKDEKQLLEVWNRTSKLVTVDVAAQEKHGKVYGDDHVFGSLQFSKCEKYLLYIAEKKRPKFEAFFDPFGKSSSKPDQSSSSTSSSKLAKGEKYTHVEEWGEQLAGKSHPAICLLAVESGSIKVLDDDGDFPVIPSSISPGQATWDPSRPTDRPTIVFVGFDHSVERLGIIYCPIRPSSLYAVDVADILSSDVDDNLKDQISEGEVVAKKQKIEDPSASAPTSCPCTRSYPKARAFGPNNASVRSPRFSPDGSTLLFLDNPVGGPHFQCSRLMAFERVNSPSKSIDECGPPSVIVDVQRDCPGKFQPTTSGIYAVSLPRFCWEMEDKPGLRIWLNTISRNDSAVLVIDVTNRSLVRKLVSKGPCFMGLFSNVVVANVSNCSYPPRLHVNGVDVEGAWESFDRLDTGTIESVVDDSGTGHLQLDPSFLISTTHYDLHPTEGKPLTFTAMLHFPWQSKVKSPLIVFPHGGPHSAFTDTWSTYVNGFLRLGFAVLKVNYRGSVGNGQDSVESLPGHVGNNDVKDVHQAALRALEEQPDRLDASKVVVFGGSHGGFLAAHLVGQYPDFYQVAACRNPVINLANMFGITDIPDWTYVEGVPEGAKLYDAGVVPSSDHYKDLISRSPIAHAHKVKSPTLIMIGLKDLRVPPTQGIQFYKALKARGVKADLKAFPEDNHTLSKVETEAECFVLIMRWFLKHLGMLEEES